MKMSGYTSALAISLALCLPLPVMAEKEKEKIPPAPVFCGAAVQVDLAGPVMRAASTRFSSLEVGARLNFRDHFFPIAELGLGQGTRTGQENNNRFHTEAPYFRVGMDYNCNKKHNGNRLMAGVRYGFSRFKYDFTAPDFTDEVWGGSDMLELTGQQASMHWIEAVVGCETKLWKFIRLGWNLRYKFRMHQSVSDYGEPWYTPGFGRTGSSTIGGTINLIFDVSRTKKKEKKNNQSTTQPVNQPL